MKQTKKNPLSYLGWLGVFGLMGASVGATWTLPFLLFFFFFTYSNAVADELFWNQVRRAGLRAFVVNVSLNSVVFLLMMITAFAVPRSAEESMREFGNGYYLVEAGLFGRQMLLVAVLIFGFIITLCTFLFTLMHYRRQEKKYVEKSEEDEAC